MNLGGSASPANFSDYLTTENPHLKVVFLDTLVGLSSQVNPRILARIDQDLKVTGDINPEIGQRWYPLSIAQDYRPAFDAAKSYVQRIGRQKYIIPVYKSLVQNGFRNLAYQWFMERKDFYHPLTVKKIQAIIFSSKFVFEENQHTFLN